MVSPQAIVGVVFIALAFGACYQLWLFLNEASTWTLLMIGAWIGVVAYIGYGTLFGKQIRSSIVSKGQATGKLTVKLDKARFIEDISSTIFGQADTINLITSILANRLRRRRPNLPVAVITLAGAGEGACGKTSLARAVNAALFGKDAEIFISGSECADKSAIWSLLGAERGYKDAEAGGTLSNKLDNQKRGVVILDKFEDFSQELKDRFSAAFKSGKLRCGLGDTDITGHIFILTTNAEPHRLKALINDGSTQSDQELSKAAETILKSSIPSDLLARSDIIALLRPLGPLDLARVATVKVAEIAKLNGISLREQDLEPSAIVAFVKDNIAQHGGLIEIQSLVERSLAHKISELADDGAQHIAISHNGEAYIVARS